MAERICLQRTMRVPGAGEASRGAEDRFPQNRLGIELPFESPDKRSEYTGECVEKSASRRRACCRLRAGAGCMPPVDASA